MITDDPHKVEISQEEEEEKEDYCDCRVLCWTANIGFFFVLMNVSKLICLSIITK
jgi:hypothetical protein